MAINLNDYEDVASLNKWFQGNFPMGSLRIIKQEHHILTDKDGNILDEIFVIQTGAFRDANDSQPATMNMARGRQSEYPKHMARFFAEDVTTSSYGRSIALLKATDKTATKDEMKRVETNETKRVYSPPNSRAAAVESALRQAFAEDKKQTQDPQPLSWSVGDVVNATASSTPNPPPECEHGMILKEGVSKSNKPYYGYVCKEKVAEHNRWAKITQNGNWYFEE